MSTYEYKDKDNLFYITVKLQQYYSISQNQIAKEFHFALISTDFLGFD